MTEEILDVDLPETTLVSVVWLMAVIWEHQGVHVQCDVLFCFAQELRVENQQPHWLAESKTRKRMPMLSGDASCACQMTKDVKQSFVFLPQAPLQLHPDDAPYQLIF